MNINNSKWSQSGLPLRLLPINLGWADIAVAWKATDRQRLEEENCDALLKGTPEVSAISSTGGERIIFLWEDRQKKKTCSPFSILVWMCIKKAVSIRKLNMYAEDWFLKLPANLKMIQICFDGNAKWLCSLKKKKHFAAFFLIPPYFLISWFRLCTATNKTSVWFSTHRAKWWVKRLGWPNVVLLGFHALITVVKRDGV